MQRRDFIVKTILASSALYFASALDLEFPCGLIDPAYAKNERSYVYPARFWVKDSNGTAVCTLCPHGCHTEGERGLCRSRFKKNNSFYSEAYGRIATIHDDPIEKAPLYHFYPGSRTACLAAAGCNARCKYCQNWEISQASPSDVKNIDVTPSEAAQLTIDRGYDVLGFSYTEPVTYIEYITDTFKEARKKNIKTYVASAGYVCKEPLSELAKCCDAFAIALKGFDEKFYEDVVGVRMNRVLDSLIHLRSLGCHVEVINLIVPSYNDDISRIGQMASWIKTELGADTPLHFLRFYPKFKMANLPQTPVSTMELAREKSVESGLRYVYLGNVPGHEGNSTYCPSCKKLVIGRIGYRVIQSHITNGKCNFCGAKISGVLGRIKLDELKDTRNKINSKKK